MFNKLTTQAYISATEALRRFKEDKKGVTAIEYGLIAVLIAVFIVFVFTNPEGFIEKLKGRFEALATLIGTKTSTLGK